MFNTRLIRPAFIEYPAKGHVPRSSFDGVFGP